MDICVVLVKVKDRKTAPARSITCNYGGGDLTIITSSSGPGVRRGSIHQLHYHFKQSKFALHFLLLSRRSRRRMR